MPMEEMRLEEKKSNALESEGLQRVMVVEAINVNRIAKPFQLAYKFLESLKWECPNTLIVAPREKKYMDIFDKNISFKIFGIKKGLGIYGKTWEEE